MDIRSMMMIAQGAVKAGQAGSRLLQPKYQNTKYGRLMRERSREGNLSQAQEKNIIDRVGSTAGRNAQVARNRYIGGAINRGMGGSVALQRGLRETEADVRRTVTDTGRDIYQSEEQAKSQAKLDYARAMDQDKKERRGAWLGVGTALADTAMQYAGQKAQEKKAMDESFQSAVEKYGREAMGVPTMGDTKDAGYYELPSGAVRYAPGGLTQDDKRAVEVYTQKANIKNVSNVTNAFSALQSGEIDGAKFREQLKSGSDPLTDEQIDELFAYLAKIGS